MIDYYKAYDLPRDANGNPYTVPGYGGAYQEMNNPMAMMTLNPQKNWSHKFVPKFSFDLQLWDNLKYHFSYSADMGFGDMTRPQLPVSIFQAIIMLHIPVWKPIRSRMLHGS